MKRTDTQIVQTPGGYTEEVLVALRRIIRASDIQSKRLRRETGLSGPQIVVLKAVATLGEVTSRDLAEHVSLSPGTTTMILDRLETAKLIKRYRSEKDRRVVHSKLTKAGETVLRNAPPLLHDKFVRDFSKLKKAEQAAIVDALETVAEMMGMQDAKIAPLLMADAAQPAH